LSLHSSEAPQGIDLSRPLFTCTNANQAATCTCNTRPRVSQHHVVNHSSQPGATIHQSSDALVLTRAHTLLTNPKIDSSGCCIPACIFKMRKKSVLLQLQQLLQQLLQFVGTPPSCRILGGSRAFPIPTTCGPHRLGLPCLLHHDFLRLLPSASSLFLRERRELY
jgi:hypothetical protein